MKKTFFMKRAQSRGHSRFARVLTMLALLLLMSMGAQAKLAKVTFAGNNKTKTVYVDLPHAFWTNNSSSSSSSYELDNIIKELWGKSGRWYTNWYDNPSVSGSTNVTLTNDQTNNACVLNINDVFTSRSRPGRR